MASVSAGLFTWHELMTPDPVKAAAFYGSLLGWSVQEVPMGDAGTYRIFNIGKRGAGGCMAAPAGMPAAWLTYVGSDDPDASIAAITEHGGKVLVPPTTVPDMVRFAVAMDPQGACFGVLKGIGPGADQAPPPPEPGAFCWDELHTKDQAAAARFYAQIFGWTGKAGDDPMKYWHWKSGEKDIGGMMDLMSPHAPPHWLAYIGVTDVEASTRKAKELGGKVHMEPMSMDKVGTFSVVEDTTGAAFALFRSARL